MTSSIIQVFKPSLGEEELAALADIFRSGWIGLGPKTAEFEEKFAAYVGASHAVGVNSATAALHLACLAAGVRPGDEVLVPAVTFVSTAHAPAYCGAKPVFVDVDRETLNIDPLDLERKITSKTKAVIPVHFGGQPCRMDEIWEIAERHDLTVIEDAAHATGSAFRGQKIGGLARTAMTCFSFQAVKNLPVGDGGMITTNRSEFVQRLKRLRWLGIDKSTWDRTEEVTQGDRDGIREYARYGWYYEVHELGFKCHMNDIAAAIGLVQLAKLDRLNASRSRIAEFYTRSFDNFEDLRCPVEQPGTVSSWHNYVIRIDDRDELNLFLKDRNIATGVHYLPLHLQPYYRRQGQPSLPTCESVWKELLSLPIYPDLTEAELCHVVDSVDEFCRHRGNSVRVDLTSSQSSSSTAAVCR